jgi:Mitochondrial carrier protein
MIRTYFCLMAIILLVALEAKVSLSGELLTTSSARKSLQPPVKRTDIRSTHRIKRKHSDDKTRKRNHYHHLSQSCIVASAATTLPAPAKLGGVLSRFDEKSNKQVLTFYGLMLAGAIARSVSATAVHPLNVIKIMLQTQGGKMPELKWSVLSRGAGSQFIMSVPHGAVNFVVTEVSARQSSICLLGLK